MREKEYYRDKLKHLQKKNPFISNTDAAYQMILDDILDETLYPGDKVPQDILAELFDMSRTPVRDALLRLEKERFLVKSDKSGYYVHKVTFQEYMDFCDYRRLIEAHAAYLAANAMTAEEVDELEQVLHAYNRACDTGDVAQVFELDHEFHKRIVTGSHNPYLCKAARSYVSQKKFFFTLSIKEKKNFRRMKNKHNRIFEAIRNNDEDEAYRWMNNHLGRVMNFYH